MSSGVLQPKREKANLATWPRCDAYHIRFMLRVMFSEIMAVTAIMFTVCHYDAAHAFSLPIAAVAAVVFGWAVWVCGPVSGPQVTPIVPISLIFIRHINFIYGLVVMVGQFIGAVIGYWLAWALLASNNQVNQDIFGVTKPTNVTAAQACGLEFLAAFWVILAVLATLDEFRPAAWATGHITAFWGFFTGTIAWLAAIVGHYTGASVSPWRSLVPALFTSHYEHQWVYWAGPIPGALTACLVYELIMTDGASAGRIKAWFTESDFDRHHDYKSDETDY